MAGVASGACAGGAAGGERAGRQCSVRVDMGSEYAVIIPALNEERHLPRTLEALKDIGEFAKPKGDIIVVDNGSEDGTVEIAKRNGAAVAVLPGVNIPALRNHGARMTDARILCFLDADCEATREWKESLGELLASPPAPIITGGPCRMPPRSSWLERILVPPPHAATRTHLPGGNLIVSRELFEAAGGFDERLSTGEDYDFCQRVRAAGGRLEIRPEFKVYHHGYPKTLGQYFRRARWHGRGDFETWEAFLHSKPAMLAVVHLASLSAALVLLAAGGAGGAAAVYAAGGVAPPVLMAGVRARARRSVRVFPALAFLYWIYFLARAVSLVDVHVLRVKGRWR